MFCRFCGNRIQDDSIFCAFCGKKQGGSGASAVGSSHITSDSTVFCNSDGKKIKKSDLSVGDTVEIFYSGQVMMSYPPQIVAAKITKL